MEAQVQAKKNFGVVTYEVKSNEVSIDESLRKHPVGKTLSSFFDKLSTDKKEVLIEVKFNKDSSFCQVATPLEDMNDLVNDPAALMQNFSMACVLAAKMGQVYFDWESSRILHTRDYNDEHYVVESSPEDIKWELINETKVINGYECKKAMCHNIEGSTITPQTIVWYYPDISLPIGPNGFIGLPGIVVEVHEKPISYHLKSIDYQAHNPIDKNAEKLMIGKRLPIEQFNKIQDAYQKDTFNRMRKSREK